ncbi:MAG: diguanylate cyclase [Treponema sp.]|nr:diguanylate cyclase [Treponema sp.]
MFMNLKRAKLISWGMAICFLFIHILMFNIFLQCNVSPMVRFNVFSICFYIFTLFVVYKEWLVFYAVSVYLEVVAHMTLAVILTGWNSGFQITLLGLCILALYAEYTGRSLKRRYIRMMPFCLLGMLLYLGTYVYLHSYPAPFSLPEKVEFSLSLMWGTIVFVIDLFILQILVLVANSSEEKLAYQLSHDKLTGLPNRYFLADKLESIKNEKENYWLAISDIDNFKKINDTNGHNCGDYVLKTIGELAAKKDILCCRWGGEEFIFIGKTSESKVTPYDFLDGFRKEIEKFTFEYQGKKFPVTMTFGLSTFSSDQNTDDIIRDADEKLYIGKQSGKNIVVVTKDIFGQGTQSYQDSLTRVKNKSAYEKMLESLNLDIQNHTTQFGIVIVKLQDIDTISKEFGSEKRNEYIIGACKLICAVFVNSQVFRTKEDEFVVVLTNRDYYDRTGLFSDLQDKYRESAENTNASPWQKYKAQCGMSVYNSTDSDVSDVFKRAEL